MSDPGGGSFPGKKLTRPKIAARPPDFKKNHCSCILEGHLPTNPILSALYPQGPNFNIYVHFQVVREQLIGVHCQNETANKINLEVKIITKPSLALRL